MRDLVGQLASKMALAVERVALHLPSLMELAQGNLSSLVLGVKITGTTCRAYVCVLASEPHSHVPLKARSEWTAHISCVLVLQEGLAGNFSNAEVTVEACPDLSQLPWGLAAPGAFMYRPRTPCP